MFLYISLRISRRQQDLSTNLTCPIYPYLLPQTNLLTYTLQIPFVLITPPSTLSSKHESKQPIGRQHNHISNNNTLNLALTNFSQNSPSPNFLENKLQVHQTLKTSLSRKAIQILSFCQLSPQKFEILSLGFRFGSTVSTLTHNLVRKSTACQTEIMKKQFHFRNQTLESKLFSYYKPSTWTHLNQNQTT